MRAAKSIDTTDEGKFDAYLNTAAHGLLELSKSARFRSYVYDEAIKQFDGDDNVLLLSLETILAANGGNMVNSFQASINQYYGNMPEVPNPLLGLHHSLDIYTDTAKIGKAIRGFPYFEEIAYIQILLPFIESVDFKEQPVIAIGLDDDSTAIGFSPLTTGGFEVIMVDEAIAKSRPVWVVNVNEVIDRPGILAEIMDKSGEKFSPEGLCPGTKSARMEKFFIQKMNETWLQGRADVNVVAAHVNSGCSAGPAKDFTPLRKVKSNQLCQWLEPTSFNLLAYCDPTNTPYALSSTEQIGLVLYEKDKRKKHQREAAFPGCSSIKLRWRSKNTEYGILDGTPFGPMTYSQITNEFSDPQFVFFLDWRPVITPGSNTCITGNPEGALEIWGYKNF
ncbi:MAG: hypothetical protein SH848_16355 [Saprospiraceae bacterium]|nr:hypothetical protein [Saprospiraceae bacterium]MDZ4705498.1 hypothetical protein [Saprospiraceae bacterium]